MQVEKLQELSNQAFDRENARLSLRERMQTNLVMPANGGLFKITPGLLAFVKSWPVDELYLEDVHGNPVQIDRQTFLVQAQQHYQTVMNAWHNEYQELQKIRKGRDA
jgi:hypothetical protein